MRKLKSLNVWATSLGCPKNRVDTERFLGSLGLPVRTVEHIGQSHLVFINTCGFIEPATRESIRAVLDVTEKLNRLKRKPLFIVAGCMVQRYGITELKKELPEVDIWLRTAEMDTWPEQIQKALDLKKVEVAQRIAPQNVTYAWLKIGEGCRHKCAFCTIPSIRGKLKSEPAAKILDEAKFLLDSGVRELILVAQDVTSWGSDFKTSVTSGTEPAISGVNAPVTNLPSLLRQLRKLPSLQWLRLLYLYPNSITSELLEVMAEQGSPLLPYLDVPFQHSEPEILRKMGRPFNSHPNDTLELIARFLPDAALRTTLIVGYPGETSEQFKRLCDFVRSARFHHLGVFAYQPEDGTLAATLPGQVAPEVREERRQELMAIQAGISRENLSKYVGQRMTVMVDAAKDDEWPGLHAGRVWFQAPEIDGITYISGPGVEVGAMVECEIEDSYYYDLSALA